MNRQFDPTKPVQTRDGRSTTILCTDFINDSGNIVARKHHCSAESDFHGYVKAEVGGVFPKWRIKK